MKISAIVTLKKEVLDPQGKVVNQTLKNMGYQNITNVRQGKYFEIEVNESDKEKAKRKVTAIPKIDFNVLNIIPSLNIRLLIVDD